MTIPVIELPKPFDQLKPWQQEAVRLREVGVGRREIALRLSKGISQVSYLFSARVRCTRGRT